MSNGTAADEYGNIQLGPNMWPFIQMFDFSADAEVDITYNRAASDETVTLVYDDGADGLSFDREFYGLKHEVGVTLTDWNLNFDPTDEDVWTFQTLPTNMGVAYQLYDENGKADAAGTAYLAGADGDYAHIFDGTTSGDIVQAGLLSLDRTGDGISQPVLDIQGNADVAGEVCGTVPDIDGNANQGLCDIADIRGKYQPITFTETGANTGVFTNWDLSLIHI